MDLNHIQPAFPAPSPSTQQVGGRIDLRLSEPVIPGLRAPGFGPSGEGAQIGSIDGVLTPEENRAIAFLFGDDGGGYTARGAMVRQGMPGLNMDLRA